MLRVSVYELVGREGTVHRFAVAGLAIILGTLTCACSDIDRLLKYKLDSTQEIASWSQEGDTLQVSLSVENTGTDEIERLSIGLKVTCTDGTEVSKSTIVFDLPEGGRRTHEIQIDLDGKRAKTVEIAWVDRFTPS